MGRIIRLTERDLSNLVRKSYYGTTYRSNQIRFQ
jgi:hypothetical protein